VIRGLLSDVHGVLYVYPRAVAGSVAAARRLEASGMPHLYLTNSSLHPKSWILSSLAEAGFTLPADRLLTAVEAAAEYLRAGGFRRVGWLCAPGLQEDLSGLEAVLPTDPFPGPVDVVLVGDLGRGFTYDVLNRAFHWLRGGAPLVAIARNRAYETQEGLVLDCGPFVSLLEDAGETRATVIGKPSAAFFQAAFRHVGLEPGETAMVGDDFEGDVLPAMRLGARGVLVRTGKFREDRYPPGTERADLLLDDFAQAVDRALEGTLGPTV
jgi:HAD superfamily hydrolase (TIGR01458 family)